LLATLRPGARVLEIGCGGGQFIRGIKRDRPDLACYGCDISSSAIALAIKTFDGVTYAVSKPDVLPYEDETFDAVVFFDVLEHVEQPGLFMQEARRVLVPNGLLYAFVPCEGDVVSLWHLLEIVHLKKNITKLYAGHIQYFSRASLKNLFRSAGFSVLKVRYSEHILGQLIGVLSFLLVHRAARKKSQQLNNEEYFAQSAVQQNYLVKVIKQFINIFIFYESALLRFIPSPNVHLFGKKN
jgi:ubiquinone/menaquinone biosynthesis C-methylase UbiE